MFLSKGVCPFYHPMNRYRLLNPTTPYPSRRYFIWPLRLLTNSECKMIQFNVLLLIISITNIIVFFLSIGCFNPRNFNVLLLQYTFNLIIYIIIMLSLFSFPFRTTNTFQIIFTYVGIRMRAFFPQKDKRFGSETVKIRTCI